MGCIVSANSTTERVNRSGAGLADAEWIEEWLEVYHESVVDLKDDIENENGELVAQLKGLGLDDIYNKSSIRDKISDRTPD